MLDRVVSGKAPSKVIAKVNEWMDLHEAEILTLWERLRRARSWDESNLFDKREQSKFTCFAERRRGRMIIQPLK